jgi:2,3-bisphosphoglycerate-independent phosphoglycerate mutase
MVSDNTNLLHNMNSKKTVLVIIDGWGYREEKKDNAIALALTPFYTRILGEYPSTLLQASESFVGLPTGVVGNSEVGHMNIGAGRRVVQDQVRINESIDEKTFFKNGILLNAIEQAKQTGKNIHLLGLVSDGCVHSSNKHYLALIELLAQQKMDADKVWFHAILDGRDTPPKSAKGFLTELETHLQKNIGRISTVMGRFFAMDRDKRWERTEQAYRAMVHGSGKQEASALTALEHAYALNETDEFMSPAILHGGKGRISPGDVIICFNFRSDRMRQIMRMFCNFEHGATIQEQLNLHCTTFTEYDKTFKLPVVFSTQDLSQCIGEYISSQNLRQFRTAETEKYAHVTFFLNGGREEPFPLEERKLIPSPKVKTYDETPAMNSKLVTEAVVERIRKSEDSLIVVNFAQPDMVGHTGIFDAAVVAVEATDQCLRDIATAGLEYGYNVFITADHGNIEMMKDPVTGQPHTSHTVNPVPLIGVGTEMKKFRFRPHGVLSDLSPTILYSMGLEIPAVMTSNNLLFK